jgi:hypothetical protein
MYYVLFNQYETGSRAVLISALLFNALFLRALNEILKIIQIIHVLFYFLSFSWSIHIFVV